MASFNDYLAQGNAWLFVPAAILLGALHGLEPGHSKTMMAAFIVAIRGTVTQAVLLGLSATLSHTAIIWVLAFVGLHYSGRFDVEATEPYFQVATGAIVVGMAAWMLARTRREQRAAADHHRTHHDDGPRGAHGGPLLQTGANEQVEVSVFEAHVPPRFRLYVTDGKNEALVPPAANRIVLETYRPDGARQLFEFVSRPGYLESTAEIPEPHEFDVVVRRSGGTYKTKFVEDLHHHAHAGVSAPFQDEHEREHAAELQKRFANQQVTTGQLLLFGLTGGLLPCPSAFAVLLVCLQLKQFTLGFALVLAFSLGLAITLVTVGSIAAFSVHHASKHFEGFGEFVRRLPYASCALMTFIGLYIAAQGLKHLM